MSAPFGPSPKLRQYLDWLRKEAGCDLKEGHRDKKSCYRIEGPDGKVVFIIGMLDTETLSHSVVANYDRRLGVDSPFPKTPQPYR